MSGLRFCFLTTFYPPYSFGGDAVGIQRLAEALAGRGHHVTVVHDRDAYRALHRGPEPAPVAPGEGIDVVGLESGVGALSCLLTQQLGRPVLNGGRIRRLLAAGSFDVVNFHNVSLIGGPGLLAYGAESVRVYMAHEHWLVCPTHVLWRHRRELCTGRECVRCQLRYRRPPQWWRYTGLLERNLAGVDAFIAMSEFSRAKHREFGFPREMDVLPYFLPDADPAPVPADEAPPHPRPYFLFVGRLERIKGLDDVIPAMRDYPGADLLIAGDGEHGEALRALAAGESRVRFLGRVPLAELGRYYRHAVALIVPSVCFETFGIILIEAFRHGTPVIARRIGPFEEILKTAGSGALFETRAELLAAMARLQADPAARTRAGCIARESFLSHWTERAVLPQYLALIRRAAARRSSPGAARVLTHMEVT